MIPHNLFMMLPVILWASRGGSGFINLSTLFTYILFHLTALISAGDVLKMPCLLQVFQPGKSSPAVCAPQGTQWAQVLLKIALSLKKTIN